MLQESPDVVRLTLTDDKFLLITERQHPAMAGDRGHLPDMIGIHDGIAVHSMKAGGGQGRFNGAKALRCQETTLGGNNPHELALGLQCEDFIQVEQKIVPSDAADQFVRTL